MGEKNELIEVIQNALSRAFEDVHTCMPGRIESYSFKEQKATVKPLIKKIYLDDTVLDMPVLGNVPIIFPRTTIAGITFPINKGDKCLLVFSERSLERWYLTGNNTEPGDRRRYDLSDAIAIPGLFSFAETNIQTNNNDLEIHNDGQRITIKANGDIEMGIEDLKKLINDDFKSQFDRHVHNVLTAGTPAAQGGVTSSPTVLAGINPILVPPTPIPVPTNLAGDAIPSSSITDKVTSQ